MKTPEETFDELFASRGGRLYPAPLYLAKSLELHRNRMQDWVKIVKPRALLSDMPTMYFDYIADESINAVAKENDGCGYIGFNWGTIVILGDVFCRMFSHPEVLKSIGNAERESLDLIFQDGVLLNGDILQEKRWGIDGPKNNQIWAAMPKDSIRGHIAEICRLLALDFLCLHELAHVGYGHTRYLKDKFGIPFLFEFNSLVSPSELQIVRQALEMSADAFAATVSLSAFLTNREDIVEHIPEIKIILDYKVAIFLWAFAITVLFYVFDPTFDLDLLETKDHLPASIRFEGNLKCGLQTAAEAYAGIKKLLEAEKLNLGLVAQAFECIGFKWPPEKVSRYTSARDDTRLDDHVKKIISRFEVLKPELKPYSHFDL